MTQYLVQLRPAEHGPYTLALLDEPVDLFQDGRPIARVPFGSQAVLGLAGTLADDGWVISRIHLIWPSADFDRPAHHVNAVERIILDDFVARGWRGAMDTLSYVVRGPAARGITAVRGTDRLTVKAAELGHIHMTGTPTTEAALLDAITRTPTMNRAVLEPGKVHLRDRFRNRLRRAR